MATSIEQWLSTAVACYRKIPDKEMAHVHFFRDPPRPQFIDYNYFFSPADGIIIYQRVVTDGDFIEVKGEKYTLSDLMQRKFEHPALVIGVFMTYYDVHINRMPMGGFLYWQFKDPIASRNLPMLFVEKGIVEKHKVEPDAMEYLKQNERVINTVYVPYMRYDYNIVQIADVDVSAITHFEMEEGEVLTQNERFSAIRWGSQVDLVLPLDSRFKFTTIHNVTDHVQAGLDKLVKVEVLDEE